MSLADPWARFFELDVSFEANHRFMVHLETVDVGARGWTRAFSENAKARVGSSLEVPEKTGDFDVYEFR